MKSKSSATAEAARLANRLNVENLIFLMSMRQCNK
jgi:hypothetical protein